MTQGIFTIAQQLQGQVRKTWGGSMPTPAVEYLVVAGGGGGGYTGGGSGGGGGGGLLQGIIPVVAGISTTVTVGSGGAYSSSYTATGSNGNNSIFGNILAYGGGGGGSSDTTGATVGANGGSGGGATGYYAWSGGFGIPGQGNAGGNGFKQSGPYTGGGGGGAGSAGLSGNASASGAGGQGVASAISGVLTAYAGGGAGGMNSAGCGPTVTGGVGGGGSMPTAANSSGNNGSTNTGGGASGGYATSANQHGGTGGSGIVILSYPDTYNAPSALTGTYTASTSGSGSLSFNGSSTYVGTGLPLSFTTNDYTIECWCNIPSLPSGNTQSTVYTILSNNSYHMWAIGNTTLFSIKKDSSNYQSITGITWPVNTWFHLAVTQSGNTQTVYLNGTSVGTLTDTTTWFNAGLSLSVGYYVYGTQSYFNGYISNLRVTNTVVYSGSFTPSTKPLTAISGTQLLMNTVSSSQFADSSSNSYAVTGASSTPPSWNQQSPFATGLGYKNRVYTWTGSGSVTF
jgi:hypothetical protein